MFIPFCQLQMLFPQQSILLFLYSLSCYCETGKHKVIYPEDSPMVESVLKPYTNVNVNGLLTERTQHNNAYMFFLVI